MLAHISGHGVRWVDSDYRDAVSGSPRTPQLTYSFVRRAELLDLPDEARPVQETIAASTADTAEEDVATGAMYLDSSDLELMSDGGEQVRAAARTPPFLMRNPPGKRAFSHP